MASHRCTPCDVSWPGTDTYKACPLCTGETWDAGDAAKLSPGEASDLLRETKERNERRVAFESLMVEREVAEFRAILDRLPETLHVDGP